MEGIGQGHYDCIRCSVALDAVIERRPRRFEFTGAAS